MRFVFFFPSLFVVQTSLASTSLEQTVRPILDDFQAQSETTGSFLVKRGNEEYYRGIGIAGESASTPNTRGTIFLIASISKHITASAILKLVDQGRLALDERVSAFFSHLEASDWVSNLCIFVFSSECKASNSES